MGILPALPLQEVIEFVCRGRDAHVPVLGIPHQRSSTRGRGHLARDAAAGSYRIMLSRGRFRDVGVSPAMQQQYVIEFVCRGGGLGTWASCPRCRCRKLSNLFVAGEV